MKLTDKIYNSVISETKQTLEWSEENVGKCLQKGYKALSIQEEQQQVKEKQYTKPFPEDITRKMRRLKNKSLNDLVKTESYKKEFIDFCTMLLAGLEMENNSNAKLKTLIKRIENYKNEVLKFKIQLEMEEMRINKQRTKIILLEDEIHNLLDKCDYTNYLDYNIVESDDKYNKYIAVNKEEIFRIKYGKHKALFKVLRDDIYSKTYVIMVGTELDVQVIELENVKQAAQFILKYISVDFDIELTNMEMTEEIKYTCFDGTIEKEIITYDTLNSIGEKIDYLLS